MQAVSDIKTQGHNNCSEKNYNEPYQKKKNHLTDLKTYF